MRTLIAAAPWLFARGCVALLLLAGQTRAADLLVIGLSLPLSGPGYQTASRVRAGAEAAVSRVNAGGGIGGRLLQLLTLDDGGDPTLHAANMRRLVTGHGAIALLGCVGERSCAQAASVATELRVPLVGPLAGDAALRHASQRMVSVLRASHGREAERIGAQLRSVGLRRVALLDDRSDGVERGAALLEALRRHDMEVRVVAMTAGDVGRASEAVAAADAQAVVLSLTPASIDAMARHAMPALARWPRLLMSPAVPGLSMLARLFPGRLLGFTMVVPNPESGLLPLTRELQVDADGGPGPTATTFEGMEAYLALRYTALALRRATRLDASGLQQALNALGPADVGGFRVGRASGASVEWVEIGHRERQGQLLR